MKRFIFAAGLLSVFIFAATLFAASPGGFEDHSGASQPQGGFAGPKLAVSTVAQVKAMADDSPVTLRGNIIQHLGKDRYVFKDSTGTISVEIDRDKWDGLVITPTDLVELYGEMDKGWSNIKVDVQQLIKVTQ